MDVGCISGVVGTMFTDRLASGARRHTQDMDLMWPALPAHNAARQHAHADTGNGTSSLLNQPSLGVAWANFSFSDPFLFRLLGCLGHEWFLDLQIYEI